MLKNYLTIALRALQRNPGHTFINVMGLAVGLACAVLILTYVRFERSFDRFHAKADRIHRVVQQQPGNLFLGSDHFVVTPAPLARALRDEVPEVEQATTFGRSRAVLLEHGTQRFVESGFRVDSLFLDVFTFPLERGNPATALDAPDAIVLTASLARKLFGEADPMGQTVRFDEEHEYTVTGIAADPPKASHIAFTFLVSLLGNRQYVDGLAQWGSSSWFTYFVLNPGQTPARVDARLRDVLARHRPDEEVRFYTQALTDIHLRSDLNFDVSENTDVRLLYLFSAIAMVILLLACVNYANLAVAHASRRAREIGMRKVVGARYSQLTVQHLGESVLTALLALGLGIGLAQLALPAFSAWLERDLVLGEPGGWRFYGVLVGLAVLVGLVAGAYPAFVMARLRPAEVLKGGAVPRLGRARLRSVLVVGQYAAAIVLIIGSMVIYEQMRFIRQRPLGFDREHVLTLSAEGVDARQELPGFKAALEEVPGISGVTASSHLPTNIGSSTSLQQWEGHPEVEDEELKIYQLMVDYAFLDIYGIPLVAGRNFSLDHPADTAGAVILNETAVRQMGWTVDTAVGKTIRSRQRDDADVPVIGVVRDFHMHAMHLPIAPLMMQINPNWASYVSARVRMDALPTTLAGIEAAWAARTPYPFEYEFLDENFDQLYRAERKLGQGVGYFTLVALFVACLGLFGLAAHTAEQRTKEIGVRKVLGASVAGLVGLLSKDFLKLVGLAFLIAAPLAYFAMAQWLEAFAYRVMLGPGVFAMAGVLALLVAFATVAWRAFRAALADPVKSLRYE